MGIQQLKSRSQFFFSLHLCRITREREREKEETCLTELILINESYLHKFCT